MPSVILDFPVGADSRGTPRWKRLLPVSPRYRSQYADNTPIYLCLGQAHAFKHLNTRNTNYTIRHSLARMEAQQDPSKVYRFLFFCVQDHRITSDVHVTWFNLTTKRTKIFERRFGAKTKKDAVARRLLLRNMGQWWFNLSLRLIKKGCIRLWRTLVERKRKKKKEDLKKHSSFSVWIEAI